jgi:hypothetical protein
LNIDKVLKKKEFESAHGVLLCEVLVTGINKKIVITCKDESMLSSPQRKSQLD